MRTGYSRARAFTLVELLVVIGIIALLISVLLPSLNKARQAGNFVDCQARLQQMGQALQIYVGQSKGLLPWGGVMRTAAAGWTDPATQFQNTPSNREQFWWWMFTLSEIMNRGPLASDGLVRNLSPVFRDTDTVQTNFRWVNHYTANPRLFYRADVPDDAPSIFSRGANPPIAPELLTQRKITSVRHPSNVFAIWDAPQLGDQENLAYGLAESIDGWSWYGLSGLCFDAPSAAFHVSQAICPGWIAPTPTNPGKGLQKKYNFDARFAFGSQGWLSHVRFRHMNNTRLAALCLDGHVETREVGTVMVKDIYTNYR